MKKLIAVFGLTVLVAASAAACASSHTSKIQDQAATQQASLEAAMQTGEAGGAWDKVPDPTTDPEIIISVYVPAAGGEGLDKQMDSVPVMEDDTLLGKLKELGALPEDVAFVSYSEEATGETEAAGPGVSAGEQTAGKAGTLTVSGLKDPDRRTVAAIVNTYIENNGLETLTLISDGTTLADKEVYEGKYKTIK